MWCRDIIMILITYRLHFLRHWHQIKDNGNRLFEPSVLSILLISCVHILYLEPASSSSGCNKRNFICYRTSLSVCSVCLVAPVECREYLPQNNPLHDWQHRGWMRAIHWSDISFSSSARLKYHLATDWCFLLIQQKSPPASIIRNLWRTRPSGLRLFINRITCRLLDTDGSLRQPPFQGKTLSSIFVPVWFMDCIFIRDCICTE